MSLIYIEAPLCCLNTSAYTWSLVGGGRESGEDLNFSPTVLSAANVLLAVCSEGGEGGLCDKPRNRFSRSCELEILI